MTIVKLPILAGLAASAAILWMPARAAETVYLYHIEHPTYGDIGTYKNTVETDGDRTEVRTELHVAVKILGMVMHREDAVRTESWQGDRLVRFDGTTTTNGKELKIHGEAKGDQFVMTTPDGVFATAANVHPSNPWSSRVLFGTDMMLTPKNGHVEKVSISSVPLAPVTFDGKQFMLKRYDIMGNVHQVVWLDQKDVPVAFRTVDSGTNVDFVMTGTPVTLADRTNPQ